MFVAHVTFGVAERDRLGVLDMLLAEAQAICAMEGCVTFLPFLDPTRADGIGVLHEWESEAHFAGYLSSPQFAGSNSAIRPLMTRAPVSKRFHATPATMAN